MVEHQFQFLATLEDVVDGRDFHSGFVQAADQAATAAVRVHMDQSGPMHQPEGLDGETGQSGMEDLEALHALLRCSEGTVQQDSQDPLDSADQDSDDVGVESVAAQMVHCSAPLDSPG